MSLFDNAVTVLGHAGHSPEEIADMLAQTLGRLVKSRCRTDAAKLNMARRAMESMRGTMR